MSERGGNDVVMGRKPVLELLAQGAAQVDSLLVQRDLRGRDVSQILDACKRAGLRWSVVPRAVLDKAAEGGNHQGVVARIFSPGFMDLGDLLSIAPQAPLPLVVFLDQVQDTGNVGTLARTLYALGGAGLVVGRHNAAYLGGVASKASAGALALLPVAKVANVSNALDAAVERGFAAYTALSAAEGESVFTARLRLPAALVLGNEDKGVRPGVAKRCAGLSIPFGRPFDSINVAQAGAIILGRFAALAQG
ncbi:MAG: RNA methyltransferase [Desulfovibrionaceae bacterium]|jgi:23S rRNA (guanosine2251-2'-O)-methyltransferase|nr:RNA methyltransferase [Desulfovibrionaceae bacterium]